jgi:hypothetical protein
MYQMYIHTSIILVIQVDNYRLQLPLGLHKLATEMWSITPAELTNPKTNHSKVF